MQYEAKTPSEYISSLDNDWRLDKLQQLRGLIRSIAPDLKEGIRYKMLSYEDQRGTVLQLNAQKNYVSLYVGDSSKVDKDGTLLKGIDVGKGCVRFKKSLQIEDTRIEEFIEKTIDMWKRGEDIDC